MEPILCTKLLPVEMWELVLDRVVSMEDLVNCQRTCSHWEKILEKRVESLLLFHKVFSVPFLRWDLSLTDMLSCRLVCHGWREGVDDCQYFSPTWQWQSCYQRRRKCGNDVRPPSQPERSFPNHLNFYKNAEHFSLDSGKILKPADDVDAPKFASIQFPQLPLSPSLARQIIYRLDIKEFAGWGESGNDLVEFTWPWQAGHKDGTHIFCYSADDRKTIISYLTAPFTSFPKLKVLQLDLHYGKVISTRRLEELETEVLEVVDGLIRKGNNMIRLNNLTELKAEIKKELKCPEMNSRFCLARWISALVSSAPRLEKVTLVLRPEFRTDETPELDRVLGAVASATPVPVKSLILENWQEVLHLNRHHWSLTRLTIDFGCIGVFQFGEKIAAPTPLRCYFDILEGFGHTLEELDIRTQRLVCSDHSRVIGHSQLRRKCFCNCHYDKYAEGSPTEEVPDLQKRCGGGPAAAAPVQNTFAKLKQLSTSHALLHPVIFPAVMNAAPTIATLRINDLGLKGWTGRNSPERVRVLLLNGLADQLWAESPPSLKLIVVDKFSLFESDYRFSRKMFENSPVSLYENAVNNSDFDQQTRLEELEECGIENKKRRRKFKCVVS